MTFSAYPAARTRARQRWHVLGDRLRTIRPEALAKGAIGVTLLALSAQLIAASWPALMPFVVGAVLAYAVLPIANRLDAVMPRVLAALLAELVAVGLLVGVAVLVIPPLINALGIVAQKLPTPEEIQAAVASVQDQVGTLPEPMQSIALALMSETAVYLQGTLQGLTNQAASVITSQILGIFGTASNLLGLLVIPVWILTMVSDERAIKRQAGRLFPEAIRVDVLALFRIVDRTLGTFLRVRVLLGVVTGALIWAGLAIADQLGFGPFNYAVAGAVLLGTLQLIPELGFFLGFFPILLAFAVGGPVSGVVAVVVYIAAVKTASALVETRLSRGVLDVHPGLLIPAIVVLSQFGLIWLLAAAPAVAIVRDLVRYANARLADPPGPAGVLPGEKVTGARAGRAATAVPSVYRAPAPSAPAPPPAPLSAASPAAPSASSRMAAAVGTSAAAIAAVTTRTRGSAPAASAAPSRTARPAPARAPLPAVYANLSPRPGARPSTATQRSTQP
jgi:predicted PurR-regulated permease PerM